MPRIYKKRGKKAQSIKQIKLLKSRLIRISMVIDDYLYKHKPVTCDNAKAYIEEVSKYKLQFLKDARSLQVIEKITRCMKSIIAELREQNNYNNYENTASENYCPSPVYSLTEEDRTMLSQISDQENIERAENNVEDSYGDDAVVQRDFQVEVEIHRTMSQLSIRDDIGTPCSDPILYSQSILKDFDANIDKESKNTKTKTSQAGEQTSNLSIKHKERKIVLDCSQSIISDFNTDIPKLARIAPTTSKITAKQNNKKTLRNAKDYIISKNNLQIKNKNFKDATETNDLSNVNPIKTNNNSNKKLKEASVKISRRKKTNSEKLPIVSKRKKKTHVEAKQNQAPINLLTTPSDKCESNNISLDFKTSSPLIKKDKKKNTYKAVHQKTLPTNETTSAYNKSMGNIYNTNIENDLSWVENIRYVREISTEEFDPKYAILGDAFWENFALPTDWNEQDFDYFD